MLHQVGVSFDLYYDARKHKIKTYHDPVPLSRNLGTLTSWNPLGLFRPVMGLIYMLFFMGMKLLGPKGNEVTGTVGDFINRDFMFCISHRDIFRVNISSIFRRSQHMAHQGRGENAYRVVVGKLEKKTKAWKI